MDSAYPPYDMSDENGAPTGFDFDIVQAIATDRKFNLEVVPKHWQELLVGMESGKYDLVIGAFPPSVVNDASKEHYSFSSPYVYTQDAIGTINQDIKIDTFDDLKNYKVSTMAGTPWVDDLTELQGETSNFVTTSTTFLAIESLIQKEVDATVSDRGVLLYYQSTMPELNLQVMKKGDSYGLVALTKKNIDGLEKQVNEGLSNIVANGTYTEIYKKWFGVEPEKIPVTP